MKKRGVLLTAILCLALAVPFALSSCGGGGENGEVYVYCYGDYYDPAVVDQFEEETGITVVASTYDTAEELYPVIANGSAEYDVICTSDYMIERLISEGLLTEYDAENIPNLVNIDEEYMTKSEEFDPGNKYSVPFQVGVAGIAYNKTMVGDTVIDSWEDLWDEQFAQSLVMPDSLREAFMIALLKEGYDMNTENETEIAAAADELIAQSDNVYKYANDSARDLLIDGSAAIGVVWNGEYLYMKEYNEDIEFVVPEKGTEFFIDSWVIPSNVKNKENAEAWINFMCDAEVAKTNFDYLTFTTPNAAAMELIDEEYLNDDAVFPSSETLSRCYSLKMLSSEGDELYSEYWKKVKA